MMHWCNIYADHLFQIIMLVSWNWPQEYFWLCMQLTFLQHWIHPSGFQRRYQSTQRPQPMFCHLKHPPSHQANMLCLAFIRSISRSACQEIAVCHTLEGNTEPATTRWLPFRIHMNAVGGAIGAAKVWMTANRFDVQQIMHVYMYSFPATHGVLAIASCMTELLWVRRMRWWMAADQRTILHTDTEDVHLSGFIQST